jgi:hypothetical protein
MPAKPRYTPPPYLVRIDMAALARNLRVRLDRTRFTHHDAARWLIRPAHYANTRDGEPSSRTDRQSYGESDYPSPFRATADPELFASDINPELVLEESEILAIYERKHPPFDGCS